MVGPSRIHQGHHWFTDVTALAEMFSYGCVLGGRTLFSGITLLPGASRWSFGTEGTAARQQLRVRVLVEAQRQVGLASREELLREKSFAACTREELTQLKVNDVLPIEIPTLIEAHVDGVPVLECQYGTSGGRYSLRVENILATNDSDLTKGKSL